MQIRLIFGSRILALILLFVFGTPYAAECTVKVTLYGGAQTISGSMAIVEADQNRIIIDCGAFFPEGTEPLKHREEKANSLNQNIPASAINAQAVILTHAHIDHTGRLPLLCKSGFQGKILMTQASAALSAVMLRNQIRYDENEKRNWIWSSKEEAKLKYPLKVHWVKTCPELKKIKDANIASGKDLIQVRREIHARLSDARDLLPCKTCAKIETEPLLNRITIFKAETEYRINDALSFFAVPAGHIPGAVSLVIDIKTRTGAYRIGFSGDVGSGGTPLLVPPKKMKDLDAVFIENTYPEARKKEPEKSIGAFNSYVYERLSKGGSVLIPAYALDRTQQVIYQLSNKGNLPDAALLFSLSSTANEISDLYRNNPGWFAVNDLNSRLMPSHLKEGFMEFPGFNKITRPSVIIATGVIINGAFKDQTIGPFLTDPKNSIVFVGYEDPDTPQGQLKAGKNFIAINGRKALVSAEVRDFGGFSGHADASQMDQWLSALAKGTTRIFLIHGEKQGLEKRLNDLKRSGWRNAIIPKYGESIEISN